LRTKGSEKKEKAAETKDAEQVTVSNARVARAQRVQEVVNFVRSQIDKTKKTTTPKLL
jgi:hypothetical protein